MPNGSGCSTICQRPTRPRFNNLFGLLPWAAAGAGKHFVVGLYRDFANLPGHFDVLPDAPEPRADRTHSASCHDMDAVDFHVHAGLVRIWAGSVLDREQHDHVYPAILDHDHARIATGPAGQYRREKEEELGPWGGGWRISSVTPSRRMGESGSMQVDLQPKAAPPPPARPPRCLRDRMGPSHECRSHADPGWNPCNEFHSRAQDIGPASELMQHGSAKLTLNHPRTCAL